MAGVIAAILHLVSLNLSFTGGAHMTNVLSHSAVSHTVFICLIAMVSSRYGFHPLMRPCNSAENGIV